MTTLVLPLSPSFFYEQPSFTFKKVLAPNWLKPSHRWGEGSKRSPKEYFSRAPRAFSFGQLLLVTLVPSYLLHLGRAAIATSFRNLLCITTKEAKIQARQSAASKIRPGNLEAILSMRRERGDGVREWRKKAKVKKKKEKNSISHRIADCGSEKDDRRGRSSKLNQSKVYLLGLGFASLSLCILSRGVNSFLSFCLFPPQT